MNDAWTARSCLTVPNSYTLNPIPSEGYTETELGELSFSFVPDKLPSWCNLNPLFGSKCS